MSAISDPDRLGRLAAYLNEDPPNVTTNEVSDALVDAAERIRSLQDRLAAINACLPDCTDGKVSVAQLAATYVAVHDPFDFGRREWNEIASIILHDLRSVRP